MGLDTTHNCWHGSYGAFARWRNALAVHLGWNLQPNAWDSMSYEIPDREQYEQRRYYGWWGMSNGKPADPILVLMVHSDCEGYIFPRHCEPLADRLEEITTGDEWVDEMTGRFVRGLRKAAEAWEIVEFR